jgi:hypothetical protein
MVSFTPLPLYPWGNNPRFSLDLGIKKDIYIYSKKDIYIRCSFPLGLMLSDFWWCSPMWLLVVFDLCVCGMCFCIPVA